MNADIFAPHFQHADKAREYLETLRWPDGRSARTGAASAITTR